MAKILVVEDDPILRELFAEFLVLAGHDVVTAATGKAAQAILTDGVEVLVTDGNLPYDHHGNPEPLGYTLCCLGRDLGVQTLLVTGDGRLLSLAQEHGYPALPKSGPEPGKALVQAVAKLVALVEVPA